jgi:hypothetical protein
VCVITALRWAVERSGRDSIGAAAGGAGASASSGAPLVAARACATVGSPLRRRCFVPEHGPFFGTVVSPQCARFLVFSGVAS